MSNYSYTREKSWERCEHTGKYDYERMIKDQRIHNESLHKLLSSREEELRRIQQELDQLQSEEKHIDSNLELGDKRLNDELDKIDSTKRDLYETDMDLRKRSQTEREMQADVHRLKCYQNTREADFKASQNVIDDLSNELNKVREMNSKSAEFEKKEKEIPDLEAKIETHKKNNEVKATRTTEISDDIRKQEKENRMYDMKFRQNKIDQLDSELKVKESDKKHLLRDLESMNKSVTQLKEQLKKLEIKNSQTEKELSDLENNSKVLHNQNIKITNEIDQLETVHGKVRRELEKVVIHNHLPGYESHATHHTLRHHHHHYDRHTHYHNDDLSIEREE